MATITPHKVSTLPASPQSDSLYFVEKGSYFEFYVTDSSGGAKKLTINNSATMIKTTNISVTGTRALIPATPLADRKSIVITNESTTESIRVGDNTVSATKGTLIKKGQTMAFDLTDGLYAIRVGANNVDISINELS